MERIYGYKQSDAISLAEKIKREGCANLNALFNSFALESGKAVGTVRNLYYAIAKHSEKDAEFRKEYLGGVSLSVSKIKSFNKKDEEWLMSKIKEGVASGKSVRNVVNELAKGDVKVALRYQNKYRNLLVKNPELARNIKQKCQQVKKDIQKPYQVPTTMLNRLKKEIDSLIGKIALKEKKENDYLKKRIAFLESENLKLSKLIYGGSVESRALDFFSSPNGAHTFH